MVYVLENNKEKEILRNRVDESVQKEDKEKEELILQYDHSNVSRIFLYSKLINSLF